VAGNHKGLLVILGEFVGHIIQSNQRALASIIDVVENVGQAAQSVNVMFMRHDNADRSDTQ
jgi:hypothetical protein